MPGARLAVRGLSALLLLAPAAVRAQEAIDLPGAIRRALLQNRDLRRSALSSEAADLGIAAARADFGLMVRPEASVGAAQGLGTREYGLGVSKKLPWGTELSAGGSESSNPALALYEDSVRFEVRQPILRNFGWLMQGAAVAQAGSAARAARRQSGMRKADLVVQVVETYETILRAGVQVRSARESVSRMEALHELTRAKEVLGRTTRVDTLRVELLRGQARSRLEAAEQRLASAQRAFAELLGASPDARFDLAPVAPLRVAVPAPAEALRIALEHRLDWAQVLQDAEDARRAARIARRGLLPDLSAVARYERFGAAPTASESRQLGQEIWFVGLAGSADLHYGRQRAAAEQAAIAEQSAAQAVEALRVAIELQVNDGLQVHERAQAEAAIAEENARLAEARSRLARALFEVGRVDNLAVTDAEEADQHAEDDLLRARDEADLSGYRLLRVLGTLVEPLEGPAAAGPRT